MGLVRILVDGYSLIHGWPEIFKGRSPFSMEARDALIAKLRHFSDIKSVPVSIFFDGAGNKGQVDPLSTRDLEVIFSKKGQTADSLIERAAYRLKAYGDVLVVTDDRAERETVHAFGVLTSDCTSFRIEIEGAEGKLREDLERKARAGKRFRNTLFE